MMTTNGIDEDVGRAAEEIAEPEETTQAARNERAITYRNGVPLLPRRDEIVTMEDVQRIMDEEGI